VSIIEHVDEQHPHLHAFVLPLDDPGCNARLIPLLSDVFFVNMSVTIMAGLGFASVLTLIVVPTLYALFYRVEKP
ncbi:MAG: hypothetical protein AAF098_18305, partial [Pseudomonadota bacterium]